MDEGAAIGLEHAGLPGLLVEPAWLEEHIESSGLRTVDLRDREAYRDGHIPGASQLDLTDLGSSVGGCDNVLVSPEEFGRLLSARGISNRHRIVAYDDQWGLAAARLAWAFHRYGHAEVSVLNGGWDRWVDEGRPTVSSAGSAGDSAAEASPASDPERPLFQATIEAEVHAETEWIAERIASGEPILLDSRTPAEFEQGHLPGAISWDWFNAVPVGSWEASRDPEELITEWKELGLDPSREVTVYCRSGMRAAHTYLVLRNAGFERVRLYDGSWQEWSLAMLESGERG